MNDLQKRTWAEISLANIRHNYRAIRDAIPEGCKFLGVVKADAYGHGAVRVAQLLESEGADYLAVSCLDEALELREAGIRMPVLILGHTPEKYTELLIDNNITQAVSNLAKAREFSARAVTAGKKLKIHIKVDTGMSRLGFLCSGDMFEEGVAHMAEACSLPGLEHEGIFTHFSVSDEEGEENREYTLAQFKLFTDVIDALSKKGITFAVRHCGNSGAVAYYPQMALDMVRPGFLLYGYGDGTGRLGLKPCMSLYTTVSSIKYYEPGTSVSYGRRFVTERRTRMGILAAGYADGIPRASSGKCSYYTEHGMIVQRGSVCMDMCMADLTDTPDVSVGDRVEIFGEHSDIGKIAEAAGTISYELLCSVTKRVPRIYLQ